jgi:hypothetical protein
VRGFLLTLFFSLFLGWGSLIAQTLPPNTTPTPPTSAASATSKGSASSAVKAASQPVKKAPEERSFREIMVLQHQQTQAAMWGILNEDYALIQKAGLWIAHHPAPSLAEKKRLAKSIAPLKARFLVVSRLVHNGAKEMVQAAKKKKMGEALDAYHRMLRGCVGCHEVMRERFQSIK